MSLTDGGIQPTMPVTPTVNNGGWGGFGGDGWWIILFFIVLFGWGGFGGNRGGVTDGYILTSDFANIERKLDGVNNGLCDGFFAQAQLINGVQQNLSNGFMSAELSRANQQSALMAQLFQMQMQSQECCCENRAAVAQVRYDMATQGCETRATPCRTPRATSSTTPTEIARPSLISLCRARCAISKARTSPSSSRPPRRRRTATLSLPSVRRPSRRIRSQIRIAAATAAVVAPKLHTESLPQRHGRHNTDT